MSSAMRDEVLAAISKFENDLGFVAPELISEKFDLLRSRVSEILEDAEDAGEPAGAPSSFTEWAAFWGGGHRTSVTITRAPSRTAARRRTRSSTSGAWTPERKTAAIEAENRMHQHAGERK